jgi:hypothetical protein
MNYPSIKAIKAAFPNLPEGRAELIRGIIEGKLSPVEHSSATEQWVEQCYNRPSNHELKMSAINDLLEMFGVEYMPEGKNAKSPAFEYCNAGDTYATTVIFINGRYVIGCWGDIVERGNYD